MNCFSELTYSVYLDHELSAEETRAVESHLTACAACRDQVERLRRENQLLVEALDEAAGAADVAVVPDRAHRGFPFAWVLPAIVAGVIALSWSVRWLSGAFPVSANWVNPFSRTALLNFFLSAAFLLSDQEQTILHWLGLVVAGAAAALLVAAIIYLLVRRWPLHVALLGAALVFAGFAKPAYSMESRSGPQTVSVPASETVQGSLLARGQTVEIAGKINGNLIAHAQRITITGTVTGDVITWSQTIDIEGTVEGNVFAAAQFVTVRGKVGQSVHAVADEFQLLNGGQVGGDVMAFCGTVNMNGSVVGDVDAHAGSVSLDGSVGRNANLYGKRVALSSSARVGNNLVVKVKRTSGFRIEPGAAIGGKTEVKLSGPLISRLLTARFYFWKAVYLGAMWVAGMVLFWLFPSLFMGKIDRAIDVLKALGWGLVLLVITPIAAVLVGLTLVGLPLALMALILWLAGLFLAKLFVAAVIGQRVTGQRGETGKAFAAALLAGLVIIFIVVALPEAGGWASLLIVLLGFGLVLNAVRQARTRRRQLAA